MLLSIKNLSVSIENEKILDNLSLEINEGEVHAIMGPNGSGKSTLSNVLAGSEEYNINSGEIKFKDKNIFDLNIEERAQEGLFLAFQYPVAIPGVSITPFLKAAVNSKLKAHGKEEVLLLRLLTPSVTIFKASISSPESVSSKIDSCGLRMLICKTSNLFFSPPENPSLTARFRTSFEKPN